MPNHDIFRLNERLTLTRSFFEDSFSKSLDSTAFAASLWFYVSEDVLNILSTDRPRIDHRDVSEASAEVVRLASLSSPKGRLDFPQVVRSVNYQLLRYVRRPSGARTSTLYSYSPTPGYTVVPLFRKFATVSLDSLKDDFDFDVDTTAALDVTTSEPHFSFPAALALYRELASTLSERKATSIFDTLLSSNGSVKIDLRSYSSVASPFVSFARGELPLSDADKDVLRQVLSTL